VRDVLRTQRNLGVRAAHRHTSWMWPVRWTSSLQEEGRNGFLIVNSYFSRRYVTEICDGLGGRNCSDAGLTRTRYEHAHFRDNLSRS